MRTKEEFAEDLLEEVMSGTSISNLMTALDEYAKIFPQSPRASSYQEGDSQAGAVADKLSRQIEVINMQNNIKSMNKQILGVLNRGKLDDNYKNVLELFTQLTEQYAKLTEILAEMLIEHKLL